MILYCNFQQEMNRYYYLYERSYEKGYEEVLGFQSRFFTLI